MRKSSNHDMRITFLIFTLLVSNIALSQFIFDENIAVDLPEPREKFEEDGPDNSIYQYMHDDGEISYVVQRITGKDEDFTDYYNSMSELKMAYKGALIGLVAEMSSLGLDFSDSTFRVYDNKLVLDVRLTSSANDYLVYIRMLSLEGKIYSFIFSNPGENSSAREAFFNSVEINKSAKQFKPKNEEEKEDKKKEEKAGLSPYEMGKLTGMILLPIIVLIIVLVVRQNRKKSKPSSEF